MNSSVNTRQSVAGADGCRAGWVVTSRHGARVVRSLSEVMDEFDVIGVDMPIGLPVNGPRQCDLDARRFLSPRGSTVFPAPPRALIHHTDYEAANEASRQAFGRGISRQAFGLFPKIREVDELVRLRPDRFVEIHPECAFLRMTGAPLAPKRRTDGQVTRVAAIAEHFGPVGLRQPGAAVDDVLDAYAVLWSVLRFIRAEHVEFGDGSRDLCGVPMRIVS